MRSPGMTSSWCEADLQFVQHPENSERKTSFLGNYVVAHRKQKKNSQSPPQKIGPPASRDLCLRSTAPDKTKTLELAWSQLFVTAFQQKLFLVPTP